MNAQTTTEQGSEWDNEQINERISYILSHHTHTPRGLARRISYEVRDDLTARLQQAEQERDEWKRQYEAINMWADERTRERDQLRLELRITKATLTSTQARLESVLDRSLENAIRIAELEGEPTETEMTE